MTTTAWIAIAIAGLLLIIGIFIIVAVGSSSSPAPNIVTPSPGTTAGNTPTTGTAGGTTSGSTSGTTSGGTTSGTTSGTPTTPVTPTCALVCNSDAAKSSEKALYQKIMSQYGSMYDFRPKTSVQADATNCDVAFDVYMRGQSSPVSSDKRRFTFTQDPGCIWTATKMGTKGSGTNA